MIVTGSRGVWKGHVDQMLTYSEQAYQDSTDSAVNPPISFPGLISHCAVCSIPHHSATPDLKKAENQVKTTVRLSKTNRPSELPHAADTSG